MRQFFKFLTSPLLLVHLALSFVVVCFIIFGTAAYLSSNTLHGESVEVPELNGDELFIAIEKLEVAGLEYQITDSVYDESLPGGTIVSQLPQAYLQVKLGRTIYVTINSFSAPAVKLPALKNKSLRQALTTLQVLGVSVEKYEYKPDICKDCVLDVLFKGKEMNTGDQLSRGSSVVLVLGLGSGQGSGTEVPMIIGESFKGAVASLVSASLNIGNVHFEKCRTSADSAKAIVFRQAPEHKSSEVTPKGSFVDVWLTSDTESVVIPSDEADSDAGFDE